jgi:hypothetical protein
MDSGAACKKEKKQSCYVAKGEREIKLQSATGQIRRGEPEATSQDS